MTKRKQRLNKLHEAISDESLEIIAILESLILHAESCRMTCTLLEMAKRKIVAVFKKNERTRWILKIN